MNDGLPLVSIVTPVYNGAKFIEDLILSVKNQDYPNIEHIIVDDGSKDEGATVEVLKKYPHVQWWTRPNKGQYATMNEGLAAAKGEFVCFVSADDVILPGAVRAAVDFLSAHSELDGMFGMTGYMDEQGKRMSYPNWFPKAPFSFVKYLVHVPHCSFYLRRTVLISHGLNFDPSLSFVGDYEWMIRIAEKRLKIKSVDKEFALIRFHPLQATQVSISSSLQERQRVFKQYRVHSVVRSLVSVVQFFHYRIWQLSEEYRTGGLKSVKVLLKKFFGKILAAG